MKPLLNIEEAANYLRVSKTSLRRWTNEGRLACVRVGARGERRFRTEDLDAFLRLAPVSTEVEAAPGEDPIAVLDAAQRRGVPRHVCLHHHDRAELWKLFRPYVSFHVQRGAPILWVHEDGLRDDVMTRLRAEGVDPEKLIAAGLLQILEPSEAYLRIGSFDPQRMVDFMESAILGFRSRGHKTALISGEMIWSLSGAPGVDQMIPYERMLNDLLLRYPDVTIVCHYDLERLGGKTTLGALCSHPHVQLADRVVGGLM
jgi:excisionase family DNA binding protein